MTSLLQAVVSALAKRGRTVPPVRLDWRGRPRGEHGPSAHASSAGTPLPVATSLYDTLAASAPVQRPAQGHD
jgi:hypothetical protein